MTAPRIGSLFTGYGGLDLAVESTFGARTAWVSDIDKGARKVLAHRFNVPNLGDLTAIEWAAVEPVEIITGGFPCQDLSGAGRGAGLTAGTRSGLWSYMRDAINIIRPRLVVAENVRGLLSAKAIRDVEPCATCVGDEPVHDVRALGAVLADLADIGYDAAWHGLPAADVGACHRRFRVFLLAYPHGEGRGSVGRLQPVGRDADGRGRADQDGARSESASPVTGPVAADTGGETGVERAGLRSEGSGGDGRRLAARSDRETLLPTPAVNDMGRSYTPEEWDAWTAKMKAAHNNGNGHGKSLEIEAARLLPTPTRRDHKDHMIRREPHRPNDTDTLSRALTDFGPYGPAVARWEAVTGRTAPSPTEPTGKGGTARLSARFTEWMMGLPDGWVTDVPDMSRSEALKACGNGVVPQQAEAALAVLLDAMEVAA